MPQSVIIHLPGGPVPVYVLRLMDSLKSRGIEHISLTIENSLSIPPAGFPKRWQSHLTLEAKETPVATESSLNSMDTDVFHIQLGDCHHGPNKPTTGHIIQCSLTDGSSGPCFPAIIRTLSKNQEYTEVAVVSKNVVSGKRSIVKGYFKTILHSYQQTLELALEGAIRLITDLTTSLISGFAPDLPDNDEYHAPVRSTDLTPSDISACVRKVRSAKIKKRLLQAFTFERWNIGIIDATISEVALSSNKTWRVEWMKEPRGRDFQADPFGISIEKGQFILFEHMQHNRGRIHALKEGKTSTILSENGTHFSYPYTFIDEGTAYMIPESSLDGEIRLFPINQLTLQIGDPIRLTLGIHAVDPSIVHYNQLWWLFCTDRSAKGADTRLHLFSADRLTGPWRPHRMNPVKIDIRSARPAGHLFIHDGILYRPSQDSSITYGGRIIINRIDQLDNERFKETPVNTIGPDMLSGPYDRGTHTLSAFGNQTCIDGKRRILNPFAFQRFFT